MESTGYKRRNQWGEVWYRLRKNWVAMVSLAVVAAIVILSVFSSWIAPYDYAKQDLGAVIEPSDLPFSYIVPVSCKDGTGFDLLEQAFDMLFPDDAPCDGSLLTNARQADAIVRAKKSVDAALRSLRAGFTPDAVLVDLEAAMRALGEVTGRTMREDITNRIFERFCVGK